LPHSTVEIMAGVARLAASLLLVVTPLIALFSIRRGTARHLLAPVVLAGILVSPFLILELVNRRAYAEPFPFLLFAMMWLMAFCFTFILLSTIRTLVQRATGSPSRWIVLPGLASLLLLAWGWIGLVSDQMPCFLGVPLCD
jgi:cellulose synthase/poly-beta-1,6-N-acetylglucosamine synthase-like glycosyltransferase